MKSKELEPVGSFCKDRAVPSLKCKYNLCTIAGRGLIMLSRSPWVSWKAWGFSVHEQVVDIN